MPSPQVMTGLTAATMVDDASSYGLVNNAAIVVADGMITWVGCQTDLPSDYAGLEHQTFDGRLVTPALIDCHTHIVHGGNRAREFEMRLNGASREEAARAGGGIVSTAAATRNATGSRVRKPPRPRARTDFARRGRGRSQIRLWSGPRHRTQDAARGAGFGARTPNPRGDKFSGCACGSKRSGCRHLYRHDMPADAGGRPCRRACRCGGWLLRRHRL